MNKIYKIINKAEYSLLTWGDPLHLNGKDVVICVTGNPGISEFYTEFASEIHKRTSLPICVINHIGHEEIRDENLNIKNHEHLFNLEGQLLQKIDFINKHIDKNSKIHLIGHSIGAWMLIELFDKYDELRDRVTSVNLLFPTIQRMSEARNGWFMNNFEMDTVVNLNDRGIEKLKHVSNVIYGQNDNWAPIEYLEDLRKFQPELQIREVNIDHAFVLKSSEPVASMVADFINKKKSRSM